MTIGIGVNSGVTPGFSNNPAITVSPAVSGSTFVVAVLISGSGAAATCADTKGNTYVAISPIIVQGSTNWLYIFTSQNAVGGAGMTVTINPPAGGNAVMQFIEITGAVTPTSIDQTSAGGSPGTAVTSMPSSAVTTTHANELILGIVADLTNALDTITATNGTLIRQDQDTTNFISIASSFQIVSSTGTFTPGFSGTTTAFYGASTLSFIQAGVSGAALAGAATDTTSDTASLTVAPAPFAPVALNSGSNAINLGTGANTGTGDPLLTAFTKLAQDNADLNQMFAQLFPNRSIQTPVTGFSITPAQGVTLLVLNPAGTLASGTINMPVNPADDQPFTVLSSQTITAITFTPAGGQTLNSAPSTLTNSAAVKWIWQAALSAWFREQ